MKIITTEKESQAVETLIALCCLPFLALLEALIVSQLWRWFLVPLGLQAISLSQACGISILCTVLAGTRRKSTGESKPLSDIGDAVVYYLTGWLFGYIAHRIMVG